MSLPLVNPFSTPYESWSMRRASPEDMRKIANATGSMTTEVQDQLRATVSTSREATVYIAGVGMDNRLEGHIDKALASDPAFAAWRASMPTKTPSELTQYQRLYPKFDAAKVDAAIEAHGVLLSEGQVLIHAGLWPDLNSSVCVMDRPLSTTFCPQVALRNAEHMGKAFDANRIDLMVLRVLQPKTKVFSFRVRGTEKGHEKETLFASGATLRLINRQQISVHRVGSANGETKEVPVYVLDVEIS